MSKRHKIIRDEQGWIIQCDDFKVLRVRDLRKTPPGAKPHLIVNLKGCNGSGKSTIPQQMIEREDEVVMLTLSKEDKLPIAMFCGTSNTIIIGRYFPEVACGGCDTLIPSQVQRIITKLWLRDYNIIFEGVIVGDIKSTFYEIMKDCRELAPREVHFCFMGTKFKECLKRIQKRNGGKKINTEQVRAKYRNSVKHLQYYLEQGDVTCWVLPTDGSRTRVYQRFLDHYAVFYPPF